MTHVMDYNMYDTIRYDTICTMLQTSILQTTMSYTILGLPEENVTTLPQYISSYTQ